MRNYIITTDMRADLTQEYAAKNHIGILPFYYEVDRVVYGGKRILSLVEYYQKLGEGKIQNALFCSKEQIKKFFSHYLENGLDILHIATTKIFNLDYIVLHQAAQELENEFPHMMIEIVDTNTVSIGLGELVKKAVDMKQNGYKMSEVVPYIKNQKQNFLGIFLLDNPCYAIKQKLISKIQGGFCCIFHRQPVLVMNEKGIVKTFSKRKKRQKKLLDELEFANKIVDKDSHFLILHGDDLEYAREISMILIKKYPYASIHIQIMNPSIGYRFGKGSIGICLIKRRPD